jgi:hypothetical protein
VTAGLERAVADASSRGMSIDDIDQSVIQPATVGAEHKAALWLLAWSFLPVDARGAEAIAVLGPTFGRR